MSKPRFLKPVLIGCACLVPVGLIVGLSVNWDHTKTISCLGSGGVKPFIEPLGEQFRKSSTGYDVTVDSGGSIFGITQVAGGYCNFGDSSKNPYETIHAYEDVVKSWKEQQLKTVTIGWEALGILYHMPHGLSKESQDAFDLYVCQDNINYLYAAFSGFNEYIDDGQVKKLDTQYTSFYNFLTPAAKAVIDKHPEDVTKCKDTQIIPVARSGGARISNSAYCFATESGLNPNVTDNQYDALSGGHYGPDRTVIETDESNAKGYSAFELIDEAGGMVYLTSAFTQKNWNTILKNSNYRFMSYQHPNSSKIVKYNFDNILSGYEWARPLNIMFSINDKHSKYEDNKKFINFIFQNLDFDKYTTVSGVTLKQSGAKPLTQLQFKSMFLNDNFWISDMDLEQTRTEFKNVYGAIR